MTVDVALVRRLRRQRVAQAADIVLRFAISVSVLILAIAVLQLARTNDNREAGTLCRARVNTEVAGISDEITGKTAELLTAAGEGREADVPVLSAELGELVARLYPAIERRDRAVTSCRR